MIHLQLIYVTRVCILKNFSKLLVESCMFPTCIYVAHILLCLLLLGVFGLVCLLALAFAP
jgi:hypothetical protein